MLVNTYEKYLVKTYFKNIGIVLLIFTSLIFFLNILEEIKFFKNFNTNIYYPILLTLLNVPSTLFEIFPFIFLISTQLIFIGFFEKEELIVFKNHGLKNSKIIFIFILTSFLFGLFLCSAFYTFSAKTKHSYLEFKNRFAMDNKYLAVINENGLWIRDEINKQINIVNADFFKGNYLEDITINQFDLNFELSKSIISKKAEIIKNEWILQDSIVFDHKNNNRVKKSEIKFKTNFNTKKINNLFSNLSSLNLVELINLRKDYKKIGYSTIEIETHIHRLSSMPIFLTIMTLIASILMFNIKYNKSKIFNIIFGIILSVSIYYIYYFFNLLGINERIPVILSIWLPNLILFLFCIIGLIRINEK